MQKPVKKLIFSIVLLIAAVCLLVGVGLAWFAANTSPSVESFDLAVNAKDLTVALTVTRDNATPTDASDDATIEITAMSFRDIKYHEKFTFTLSMTASHEGAQTVNVSLTGITAGTFDYKTAGSDSVLSTNYGALIQAERLSGDFGAGTVNGDLSGSTRDILSSSVFTATADKMTATLVFTLTYGNYINADESKLMISTGAVSVKTLSVRSA